MAHFKVGSVVVVQADRAEAPSSVMGPRTGYPRPCASKLTVSVPTHPGSGA